MYCRNCGKQLDDGVVYCPYCGSKQKDEPKSSPYAPRQASPYTPSGSANGNTGSPYTPDQSASAQKNDSKSFGFALLGFFFPLIGLILFLCWKGSYPLRAKSCGKGALIGFIVEIVLWIALFLLFAFVLRDELAYLTNAFPEIILRLLLVH